MNRDREVKEKIAKALHYIDRAVSKTFLFAEIEDKESIIRCVSFKGEDIVVLLKNIRRDLMEAYNVLSDIIEKENL